MSSGQGNPSEQNDGILNTSKYSCTDEEQISDFKLCILILSLIVLKKNICYCEGLAILF